MMGWGAGLRPREKGFGFCAYPLVDGGLQIYHESVYIRSAIGQTEQRSTENKQIQRDATNSDMYPDLEGNPRLVVDRAKETQRIL